MMQLLATANGTGESSRRPRRGRRPGRSKKPVMNTRLAIPVFPEFKDEIEEMADAVHLNITDITRESLEFALQMWRKTGKFEFPSLTPQLVPLLGEICAGDGISVVPITNQHVILPEGIRGGETRFALRVVGDSMDGLAGHSIIEGMICVFDAAKEIYPNCVASIEWEEKGERVCTVKKLKYRLGEEKVILKPTNPRYQPKTRLFSEIEIKGVLVTGVPGEEAKIVEQ